MVHVAKELDLPQRPLGVDVVVERVPDFLDRNLLSSVGANSRAAKGETKQGNISTATFGGRASA
jgi:hypothetical protein